MARSISQEEINQLQSFLDNPDYDYDWITGPTSKKLFDYYYFPNVDATNVNDVMKFASQYNLELTPYQEKYLDNLLSQYNAQHDILNQAGQLQSLGLSAGSVNPSGMGHASQVYHNTADAREQRKVQQASNRIGLAKAFLSLAGGLSASGIYGHTQKMVRHSAEKVAAMSAASAEKVANIHGMNSLGLEKYKRLHHHISYPQGQSSSDSGSYSGRRYSKEMYDLARNRDWLDDDDY